jgi:Kef-type K+ transport system membrane component KefB
MMPLAIDSSLFQIAVILSLAGLLATIANGLKQPLLIGYLFMGLLAGNLDIEWLEATAEVELLAKTGVAILLFLVGLRLDLSSIKNLGKISLATGIGQIVFTSFFGFLICLGFGFSYLSSFYISVALTFSSTIIIIKLLSDKNEIDSVHGRIAVGLLIVQDIAVILIMIVITAMGRMETYADVGADLATLLLSVVVWIAIIYVFMNYILPMWTKRLASSRELLMLFAVAWALVWSSLGEIFGFSVEIGAFVAGMMLASTPYSTTIGARVVPLRDFLIPFFFFELGSNFQIQLLGDQLTAGVVLSLFVLIGNPLIVMAIMGFMGYRNRTGFLTGVTVAQISEFSLIFAALGLSLGHISTDVFNIITLVGIVTIGLSTYLIMYSVPIYEYLAPYLEIFQRKVPYSEQLGELAETKKRDIVLFGLGRYGLGLCEALKESGFSVTAIDFDHQALERAEKHGIEANYGDVEDLEFVDALPFHQYKWIVNTISSTHLSKLLVDNLREAGFKGKIAQTVYRDDQEAKLPTDKIDLILKPYDDAAMEACQLLRTREFMMSRTLA